MIKRKTIIISGGSSGIGKNICQFLINRGYDVINLDIKKTKSVHKNLKYIKLDISKHKEIKKILHKISKIKNLFIYGLINCAGITKPKNTLNYDINNWNKTIETNLTGPFFLCKEVSKLMIKKKIKGSIINFTSISSELAMPNNPAYNASKAGLKHLTKSIASDLSKYSIRANNISPGYTKTSMNKKSWKKISLRKKRAERNLMNRWADPSEYNEAALFLLDNQKSSYVTGSDIIIDGGWTVKGL